MTLQNIIYRVNSINSFLNFPSFIVSTIIAGPIVRSIGRRMDYKFLRPVKYFLGAVVIGPIAGILNSFLWAEQLTMAMVLYNLIPLGLPLLSLAGLTVAAGAAMGLVRTLVGVAVNHLGTNPFNKRIGYYNHQLITPLALGIDSGMNCANTFSQSSDDKENTIIYSKEMVKDGLEFGLRLSVSKKK